MRWIILFFLCLSTLGYAQELFIFSEPASTMPKRAVALRINSRHYGTPSGYFYKINPEIGYGLHKNFTARVNGFYSNWANPQGYWDAVGISTKYKILTIDEHHAHKRLAVTGRLVYSFQPLPMEWMMGEGNTSMASGGIVYTQLIHKLALSGKLIYSKLLQGWNKNHGYLISGEVLEWQVSSGFLVLPIHYEHFKQVNVNLYAEYLGQQNLGVIMDERSPASYSINHDLGLGTQLIFASRLTLELACRLNIGGNMDRPTHSTYYLNLEYRIFR